MFAILQFAEEFLVSAVVNAQYNIDRLKEACKHDIYPQFRNYIEGRRASIQLHHLSLYEIRSN